MKTIYIVTRGEYSDYCIDKIFLTRDLAERYIQLELELARLGEYSDFCIEEHYLIEKEE